VLNYAENQLTKEEMAKKRIAVCTPTRDGQVDGSYASSLYYLQKFGAEKYDIEPTIVAGVSDISGGRNKIWNKWYYQTDVEYIFWLDSDISFMPQDVIKLFEYNVDVIGGNYPKKSLNVRTILETAHLMQNVYGEIDAQKCLEASYSYVSAGRHDEFTTGDKAGLARTERLGMGFLIISREGAKKLMDWAEENMERCTYHNQSGEDFTGYSVFDPIVNGEGMYQAEDYAFCERMKMAGMELYIHPQLHLRHSGLASFDGRFSSVMDLFKDAKEKGFSLPSADYVDHSKEEADLKPEFED